MRKMNLSSTHDTMMTRKHIDSLLSHVSEHDSPENPVYKKLQYSLIELAVLKNALDISQQQIGTLKKTNACQKQKLIRFARKLVQANYLGYYDELTKLPNRRLLLDRLEQEMARSDRQHNKITLLFIDIDKFKSINDEFGHAVGDKLLLQFAERLVTCIRYGDTACRYGGDEFVIMLPEMNTPEDVVVVTEKIRAQLTKSYVVDDRVIAISISIGNAVYPADGKNSSELIKQADIAMYLAKTRKIAKTLDKE